MRRKPVASIGKKQKKKEEKKKQDRNKKKKPTKTWSAFGFERFEFRDWVDWASLPPFFQLTGLQLRITDCKPAGQEQEEEEEPTLTLMRCILWQRLIRQKPRRQRHGIPNHHFFFPSPSHSNMYSLPPCRAPHWPACDTWPVEFPLSFHPTYIWVATISMEYGILLTKYSVLPTTSSPP